MLAEEGGEVHLTLLDLVPFTSSLLTLALGGSLAKLDLSKILVLIIFVGHLPCLSSSSSEPEHVGYCKCVLLWSRLLHTFVLGRAYSDKCRIREEWTLRLNRKGFIVRSSHIKPGLFISMAIMVCPTLRLCALFTPQTSYIPNMKALACALHLTKRKL